MSSLRHPNIVQFIGICLHPSSPLPILVMENLKSQLHQLLVTCSTIPLILKQSILSDIARGLAHLHPQVIHRDLSAKNILLTPFFTAKICDFGSSLSSDSNARPHELTPYPGERVYMPPEALIDQPIYGCSMDIFSFGHLALFSIIQVPQSNLTTRTIKLLLMIIIIFSIYNIICRYFPMILSQAIVIQRASLK